MHHLRTVALLIMSVWLGCAGGRYLDNDLTGKTRSYVPGLPDFDLETVLTPNAGTTTAEIHLSIPPSSLTYTRIGSRYRSLFEVSARIRLPESDDIVADRAWPETTWVDDYDATQHGTPVRVLEHMPLPEGVYVLEVSLEDRNTGKQALRRQEVTAYKAGGGLPAIGRIRLDKRNSAGTYELLVSGYLPSGLDSVRSSVDVFNLPKGRTILLHFLLTRHQPDTLVANAPYRFSHVLFQQTYLQLEHTRADTVYYGVEDLNGYPEPISAIFYLPPLPKGMYKLSCRVEVPQGSSEGEDTVITSARLVSVENPSYPRPTTLDEFISAFRYIATENELALFREAPSAARKKVIFDSLWLSFGGNMERASALIRRYYSRVEEANKRFTTVKEGWKTDRGMVFIVLGPPAEISTSGTELVYWHYELPRTRDVTTFTFRRVIVEGEGAIFHEYVLIRLIDFESPWLQSVGMWRRGEAY